LILAFDVLSITWRAFAGKELVRKRERGGQETVNISNDIRNVIHGSLAWYSSSIMIHMPTVETKMAFYPD
jgi:hypothetical protein